MSEGKYSNKHIALAESEKQYLDVYSSKEWQALKKVSVMFLNFMI